MRIDEDAIATEVDTISLELGADIVYSLNRTISAFAVADYMFNIGGDKREALKAISG